MKKNDIKEFILKLKRKPESHKYDYGHVLVIAGSKNMPGAGILCCNAALRAGAGLVTYAVKEKFLNSAAAMSSPETIFFVYSSVSDILKFVKNRKVTSIVVGPGLEAGKKLHDLIKKIIFSVGIPVVLDASGLISFRGSISDLKKAKAELVITPHQGEFSQLTGQNIKTVKEFRAKTVETFARKNLLICVLKGNKSIVSDGKLFYENNTGTPAMATAGSGDVLSGVIAAFSHLGGNLFDNVKSAVFIHGLAGELSETDKGSAGIIAGDIVDNLPYAIKSIATAGGK